MFQTTLSKIILIVGLSFVIIVIFLTGEEIGFRKAQFSYRFGDNYNRMFGGRSQGRMMPFGDDILLPSDGASGTIIKVSLPKIFLESDNGVEKVVTLDNNSLVRKFRESIASTTLKVGDYIVVLGEPDSAGTVHAGLVRVIATSTSQ